MTPQQQHSEINQESQHAAQTELLVTDPFDKENIVSVVVPVRCSITSIVKTINIENQIRSAFCQRKLKLKDRVVVHSVHVRNCKNTSSSPVTVNILGACTISIPSNAPTDFEDKCVFTHSISPKLKGRIARIGGYSNENELWKGAVKLTPNDSLNSTRLDHCKVPITCMGAWIIMKNIPSEGQSHIYNVNTQQHIDAESGWHYIWPSYVIDLLNNSFLKALHEVLQHVYDRKQNNGFIIELESKTGNLEAENSVSLDVRIAISCIKKPTVVYC